MKLRRLLQQYPEITVRGSRDIEITGVCSDSRLIAPGNLFIARKGLTHDGTAFVPEAAAHGAAAVLTDLYDPSLRGLTQVISSEVHTLEAPLAAQFYGHPSHDLFTVGITGTNGKTTTAFIIRHLLEALSIRCGLMGSIEHIVGPLRYRATRTTPSVTVTHRVLGDMVRAGCQAAVMEVTSHGLDQGRVDEVDFDIGIFTNLTQDHLDYHKDMEAYGAAKAKLFTRVKQAIVNANDPNSATMCKDCTAPVLSYGLDVTCDLRASQLQLSLQGSCFTVTYGDQSQLFRIPLVGRFNVANTLAAIGVGCTRGVALSQMALCLETIPPVSGRLERIKGTQGPQVLVDHAHTPNALEQVLKCLQEVTSGPIITVFGCGGNRDAKKRPLMGQIVSQHSDQWIVTSDNPRAEDPKEICNAIVSELTPSPKWEICLDRQEAIGRAISSAPPNATILIAGKGHESTQVHKQGTVPFDDRQVARQFLS